MRNWRYIFEPYNGGKGRHTCPNPTCGKSKKFTRYLDSWGLLELPDYVGKCERVNSCGYNYTPYDYLRDNPTAKPKYSPANFVNFHFRPKEEKKISYIDAEIFRNSFRCYYENNFVTLLKRTFGIEKAQNAVRMYQIGTSKHYKNGVVFWQINRFQGVLSGKIMGYDLQTGKRIYFYYTETDKNGNLKTEKKSLVNWVHKVLKLPNFNHASCLFGEHLIDANKGKTVAIVESEKTAVIMSIIQPWYLWLACGSASNLTTNMLQNIKDREIIGFPDVGRLSNWKAQANYLNATGFNIVVSELIEKAATPEQEGDDIADFYLQFGKPYEIPNEWKELTPQEKQLAEMVENNSNLANLVHLFKCKIMYDNSLYHNLLS